MDDYDIAEDPQEQDANEMRVGERIKQVREQKGITLQQLADKCGFSSALLSQLENHLISPPLGTLVKIGRALDMEIGGFFEATREAPFTIVRRDERKNVSRVASKEGAKYGYSYESLAFDKKGRHMEPFLVTLEPATVRERHAYSHEGEEFLFVLEGKMEVQLDEKIEVLEPGDSIYFDSVIPHRVQCAGDESAKVLAVIYTGLRVD